MSHPSGQAPGTEQRPKRSGARRDPPLRLVGAAAFAKDAAELSSAQLIRIVRNSALFDELRSATDYSTMSVRKRDPGEWALALLAFATSPIPDLQPWWRDSDIEMWWECGFNKRPSYDTVWLRFTELQHNDAARDFFETTAKLVRLSIAMSDGLVCRDLMVDATEAESNARMFHDCEDHENCPGFRSRRPSNQTNGPRAAAHLETSDAKQIRGEAAQTLPEDEEAPLIGDAEKLYFDERRHLLRIKVAGHWWRISDPTAGCRTQEGNGGGVKSWIGFTRMQAPCLMVGLSPVVEVASASEQEHHIWPRVYEKIKYVLGGPPRSIIGDKGPATKAVFQMHSDDGVFTVMPFRGHRDEPKPVDRERFDRHGVPRCENCGGPTRFVSFTNKPKARVFFECVRRPFTECQGRQWLYCEEDPRFILPLWRNSALFWSLKEAGMEHERAHRLARQRNGSGGNSFYTRPKRKGRDWQQLLADAGNCADWLKLCWRNGWLPGSKARTDEDPTPVDGSAKHAAFLERRRTRGLERHYGARAVALGLSHQRRLPQYDETLTLTPSPTPEPRRGSQRPLTALPDGQEVAYTPAYKKPSNSRAAKAARAKAKADTGSQPADTTDNSAETDPALTEAPMPSSTSDAQRRRARAARKRPRGGPDPPG